MGNPQSWPRPCLVAGAWRAPDGNVGLALASIQEDPLPLRLPIDARAYGLPPRSAVYRIDQEGRQRLGLFDAHRGEFSLVLPPQGVCLLEFCPDERP